MAEKKFLHQIEKNLKDEEPKKEISVKEKEYDAAVTSNEKSKCTENK